MAQSLERATRGFKFRRQEVIGRVIVDFFCPAKNLIVEVDGETHADTERDRRRDAYLRGFGFPCCTSPTMT